MVYLFTSLIPHYFTSLIYSLPSSSLPHSRTVSHILIGLCLTAWPLLVQGQHPGTHDGLGPFHFGTPLSDLEDELQGTLQISYGQEYFLYLGDSMDTFYGLKVRKVTLGFYQDKLNYIDVYFKNLDLQDYQALLSMAEQDFGPAEEFEDPSETGILDSFRWKGENIYLQLIRYGKGAIDWDDREMTILMAQLGRQ